MAGDVMPAPHARAFAAHEAEVEIGCVPLAPPPSVAPVADDPLYRASLYLTRSFEAGSMMRSSLLYSAGAELRKSGYRPWAELAECAADRLGGDDQDVRQLLFEVDAEISRRRHA